MTTPRLISNRADATNTYPSSGSATMFTFRVPFRAMVAASSLRLVYTNKQFVNTTGEGNPADTVTVKASIELSDGTLWPVFFGGVREKALAPGESVTSDAVPVALAKNDLFFVRSRPLVDTLGKKWGTAGAPLKGGYLGGAARSGQDLTDSGADTAFPTANTVPFGPAAILGIQEAPAPVTGIVVGSSTAYGSGDVNDNDGDYGFVSRTLAANGIPHFRLSAPGLAVSHILGATAADVPGKTAYHRALIELTRPTHAFISLGNNDVHKSTFTLADNKAALLRYFDFFAGQGLKLIASTVTPRTTGTWTTLVGQTKSAAVVNTKRHAFNDWLRTAPHSALVDVWDVAAIAQEPTDPDLWRVDGGAWTNDGTHMSAIGHSSVARALAPQARSVELLYTDANRLRGANAVH